MKRYQKILRKAGASILCAAVLLSSMMSGAVSNAEAAGEAANPQATLTVDLDPEANTGDIIHGAAGFLYGVSSEDVPTTNTIVPLKSKILVTKGAVGTEHPYGDALDVAKTFLESGGEQIQMYNSNYYGVFGVSATIERYCDDLKKYICPAIVAWKEAWNEEHGTPDAPKDNIGAQIDIDEAIVYVPINEGTPNGGNFQKAWKSFYDAIKSVDPKASLAGPNGWGYNGGYTSGQSERTFVQFCADNNCMPNVYTWHELNTGSLRDMSVHMDDFRNIWNNLTDWTKYNEANGLEEGTTPEIPQICFNEYAEMDYCGVPGRLVNWISRIEDEKVTGCLPFWHQANNLNDLAAGANEGNGAWWVYKWYGDMSGVTQPVSSNTSYERLYGVSTMDEAKKMSTTLLGGFTGDITVNLNNVNATETFKDASIVHVTVQETMFTGFHGAANETPVILEGAYPINSDGSVTLKIPNAKFENAYNVTVTQASADEIVNMALMSSSGDIYEAENAALSNGASATSAGTNPSYYMSSDGQSGNRAVSMPKGAVMTYTINVPTDGKYKLAFNYGNGQGTQRNDMNSHNPVNLTQTFSLDGGEAQIVTMESTLWQTMTGTKTLYYDLTAGEHKITITTNSEASRDMLFHDFLRVSYAGVYNQPIPLFNKVYEAEHADVNRLLGNTDSTVSTQTDIAGYSGGGYVTGLSERLVSKGGGIRNTVVVEESGLYNITLRYHSGAAGEANIYVGNTAVTLNRVNKTVSLQAGDGWQEVTASIYLQTGINVVDIDMTTAAALDYMRVRALPAQSSSTTIEAEDAIPDGLADAIQVADSDGASGGKYVVGMKGDYQNPNYLEFTYNAPAAGKYQMQAFHSNEDLAGSHSYNIKATDKYAVVEVNGKSGSPKFTLAGDDVPEAKLYYFVDCGDHGVSTVSDGDKLGVNNSVTDKLYGADPATGYQWGVYDPNDDGTADAGLIDDEGVYTTYTWAHERDKSSDNVALDNLDKSTTFRYARAQDTAGFNPRYITYKFELDPGKYSVTVGMGNSWGNATNPTVTLSALGVENVSTSYTAPQAKTLDIDLTGAETNTDGKVELSVKATSSEATIQMNYIAITEPVSETEGDYVYLPPYNEKALGGEHLPDGIFMGELAEGIDRFIDFRNLKNDTDRYFFINTFSDDTFREKTITLDLKEGENTIRIYNDNSWNVTYGGTTGTPGTNNLVNYTPNFDKFIITPMALTTAVSMDEAYPIDVDYTDSGIAFADHNTAGVNGEYTVSMIPGAGRNLVHVLVNGEEKISSAVYHAETNSYTLKVTGVSKDQKVQVYFGKPDTAKETLQNLYNLYEELEQGTYSAESWAAFAAARTNASQILGNEEASQWQINNAYDTFIAAINNLADVKDLIYFVDCGDHNPATLSEGDSFGQNNSVTDQMYGPDAETGYSWGVEMVDEREVETPGGSVTTPSPDDKAVYTNFQKALSNGAGDLVDGQPKESTLRYAHNQDSSGINPRYVSYKFEIEPGAYMVTVRMNNGWGNASSPTVNLMADGVETVSERYAAPQVKTMNIDLTGATLNDNGKVELTVRATSTQATIQMSYIIIEKASEAAVFESLEVTEPSELSYEVGDEFNAGGMVVRALYSDGSSRVLTSEQYVLSGFSTETAGTKTVTVSYTDGEITKTAEFEITVSAPTSIWRELLKQTIDAANAVKDAGFKPNIVEAVKEMFLTALSDAEKLYQNPDATDEQLKEADDLLILTMQYLEFTADKKGLEEAINNAQEIIDSEGYVHDDKMDKFIAAVDEARELLEDPYATDTEIGPAIEKIADAQKELTPVTPEELDVSVLEHQINLSKNAYDNLSKYFDGAEKDAFKAAYEKAVKVLADAKAGLDTVTQKDIDDAADALHAARLGLRLIPNKDELKNLLDKAGAKDLSKYTKESGAVLQLAIDAAKAVYDDPMATVEQVEAAEAVLNAAMNNLVPIKNGEPGTDTPTGDSTPIAGLILLSIAALGGMVLSRKKK